MSSFNAYGIDGEEENSHFIDDEDEQSFTAAGEDYASHPGDFQLTVTWPSTTPPHRLRSMNSTIQTLATLNLRSTRSTWIMEMGMRTVTVVSVKTKLASASTTVFLAWAFQSFWFIIYLFIFVRFEFSDLLIFPNLICILLQSA